MFEFIRRKKHRRLVIRISKAAFVVRVLGVVLALNLMILPAAQALTKTAGEVPVETTAQTRLETNYATVVVASGDTLWSLVETHYNGEEDIRKIIFQVKELNRTGSIIHPGDQLLIPLQ